MGYVITKAMLQFARHMKRHAETGHYTGWIETTSMNYFDSAKRRHRPTGTSMIFTRDKGMHSCGWWKNPEYERCYHLSLSFWEIGTNIMRPFDHKLAKTWCCAFFGDWTRYIWEEGMTDENRKSGQFAEKIRHFRVFCDPAWQPIVPRGEVYTKEFIEKGWKSWSDQQYELQRGQR